MVRQYFVKKQLQDQPRLTSSSIYIFCVWVKNDMYMWLIMIVYYVWLPGLCIVRKSLCCVPTTWFRILTVFSSFFLSFCTFTFSVVCSSCYRLERRPAFLPYWWDSYKGMSSPHSISCLMGMTQLRCCWNTGSWRRAALPARSTHRGKGKRPLLEILFGPAKLRLVFRFFASRFWPNWSFNCMDPSRLGINYPLRY